MTNILTGIYFHGRVCDCNFMSTWQESELLLYAQWQSVVYQWKPTNVPTINTFHFIPRNIFDRLAENCDKRKTVIAQDLEHFLTHVYDGVMNKSTSFAVLSLCGRWENQFYGRFTLARHRNDSSQLSSIKWSFRGAFVNFRQQYFG